MKKTFPEKFLARKILLIPPDHAVQASNLKPGHRGIVVELGFSLPEGQYPAKCHLFLDGLKEMVVVGGNDEWQAFFRAIDIMRMELFTYESTGWNMELYEAGSEISGHKPGYAVSVDSLTSFRDLTTKLRSSSEKKT
jgi:hypothetical protein